MSEITTDAPFAPVPLWLVESDVSDRALRLYALLAALRDFTTDRVTVFGRRYLAEKLRCSVDTVDRAKAELVKAGALTVIQRRDGARNDVNEYVIQRLDPEMRRKADEYDRMKGGRTDAATRDEGRSQGRTDAAHYRESQNTLFGSSSSPLDELAEAAATPAPPFPVKKVGAKVVTPMEQALARGILAAFNAQFGSDFRGREHFIDVVGRIRERPDLTLDDHVAIIARFSGTTWWRRGRDGRTVKHPTPAHLYGSGKALDAAINFQGDGDGAQTDDLDAYTRGS